MTAKLLLLAALLGAAALALAGEQVKLGQDNDGRQYLSPRLMFFRSSLMREPQVGGKRASGDLDPLAGMTLGKRSNPLGLINMEPIFGRQYAMRSMPRMYDLRWAPLDSYEAPAPTGDQY